MELYASYGEQGGSEKKRSRFMSLLTNQLKDEVYVFTSPGLASILMLKEKASKSFTLMSAEENEDDDVPLQKVATRIRSELNKIPYDGKRYTVLNNDNLFDDCSPTLASLLSIVSPKFVNSLSNAMVGHYRTVLRPQYQTTTCDSHVS